MTNGRASYLYPILQQLVIPYFLGKDARRLEALLDGVYVYQSNYKLSGVAFWCCVAWVELSILDLLGKIARRPVGELLGGAVQVVQPDLHYNGGFIRAARVAHMAARAGTSIVPHMSGEGVGYVDVLQFASCTPNMGPFQEYKGDLERTGPWYDPPLRLKDGAINVPTGPGLGIAVDVLRDAKPM